MNNAQQSARVGLFFLLGVALIWVTYETLGGGGLFGKGGYHLIARFDNLLQIKRGDDVRVAGVKVGEVETTRLEGRRAEAVLHIDPGVQIASDSTASISTAGLIGTNYIGVDVGSTGAPALKDGAEIKTVENANLNTIMTELGDLGKKLESTLDSFSTSINGNGKEGGIFQKLDRLVTENSAKLNDTFSNFREISAKLNNGQGTLGKLLNNSDLHDQLVSAVNELKTTAVQAREMVAEGKEAFDQAKSGKSAIGVLLYDQQAADNLRASVENFRQVSDKIARGEGTLGKLINDDSLFNSAKNSLQKADRAMDSLNDSGPISAVGILANSLF